LQEGHGGTGSVSSTIFAGNAVELTAVEDDDEVL
jgi:hypothetical protein